MRVLAWLSTCTMAVTCVPASSKADCTADQIAAETIALSLRVDVQPGTPQRVGTPIQVRWAAAAPAARTGPLYLVFSTGDEMRFSGKGFFALTPQGKPPNGLKLDPGSHALVPLHLDPADATGEMSVLPYRQGAMKLSWAVMVAGQCRKEPFGRGERAVAVGAGTPELVLQDRFSDASPRQRIRSKNGRYDLLVFDGRYEVHDALSGEKLVDRAGRDPNFSPTAQFVAARRVVDSQLEVVDLTSNNVTQLGDGILAWARGDSFLVFAGLDWGKLQGRNVLDDHGLIMRAEGCHACGVWDERVILDTDRGFVALVREDGSGLVAPLTARLPDAAETETEPSGNDAVHASTSAEKSEEEPQGTADVLATIRSKYGDYPGLPRRWDLGEPLAFSHITENRYLTEQTKAQRRYLVKHQTVGTRVQPTQTGEGGTVRGRTRSWRGFVGAEPSAEGSAARTWTETVLNRIAAFGLPLAPGHEVERVFLNPDIWGGLERSDDQEEKRTEAALRAAVPVLGSVLARSFECTFEDAPGASGTRIDPRYVSQVWSFGEGGEKRYLVQTICTGGNAGIGTSQFYVIGERDKQLTQIEQPKDPMGTMLDEAAMRARADRVRDNWIALAMPNPGLGFIVDAETRKALQTTWSIENGNLLAATRLTKDGNDVLQLNADGSFVLRRLANDKRVLIGAHVDDEIVVTREDGLYDATYEGAEAVQVRFPGLPGLFRFNQFEAALRRSNLASATITGQEVRPAPSDIPVPPTAVLSLPAETRKGRRIARVTANAGGTLRAVRLYQDGRLLEERAVSGEHAELAFELPALGGGHWISALAIDARGIASLASAVRTSGPAQPDGVLRAVLIGVDRYADPSLPPLGSAKIDASSLEAALRGLPKAVRRDIAVTKLTDQNAGAAAILGAVETAARATGPEDKLVLFYAGHGVDGRSLKQPDIGFALTTSETKIADLARTAVPWAELAKRLNLSRGSVLVVLDACHAGLAGNDAFATNDAAVSALFTKAGAPIVVLAASKGRQLSEETTQGGRFTQTLAQKIIDRRGTDQDRSGLIDLGELYAAVKRDVVLATKGRQTPWLVRNGMVGEMALF